MKIKSSGFVHYYYSFVMFAVISSLSVGIYSYWFDGPANVENINAIFEASILVDNFKKREDLKIIRNKVNSDQTTDAVKSIVLFQNDLHQINKIIAKQADDEQLNEAITSLKVSMNNIISLSDLATVMSVLSSKLDEFEQMVSLNNWRTLTRIAGRLKAQLVYKKGPGSEIYNQSRLSALNKNLISEINLIKNITETSVLSRQNKDMILAKIDTLNVELTMLDKSLREMEKFNLALNFLETTYAKWIEQISPDIDDKRELLEKRSQMLLLILSGIIGFAILSTFLGFILNRQSTKSNRVQMEKNFIKLINEGLLPIKDVEINLSEKFGREFLKVKDYLHKRMSFGSYFQDALPFPAILLDHNLNLIWGNGLFYEIWNLEKIKNSSSAITWDYLQQFTNLGEDDPILLAIRDKIAGIYQIQIKTTSKNENIPYEMYVSPIEHGGVSRVMIFLYPLVSMEETISNQTKSIVGPISRMLDYFITKNFDLPIKDKIEKDFDVVGIKKIFEKFWILNEKNEAEKKSLQDEIAKLEGNLNDKTKLVHSLGGISKDLIADTNDIFKTMGSVKTNLISVVEVRNEIETLFQSTVKIIKQVLGDKKIIIDSLIKSRNIISETSGSFEKVRASRDLLKKQKVAIDNYVSQMVQHMNEMLMSEKSDDSTSYRVKQVLSATKQEIKGLDVLVKKVSEEMVNLDVGISKIDMINNGFVLPDFKNGRDEFNSANGLVETAIQEMNNLCVVGQQGDEKLILALKELVSRLNKVSDDLAFATNLVENEADLLNIPIIPTIPALATNILDDKITGPQFF